MKSSSVNISRVNVYNSFRNLKEIVLVIVCHKRLVSSASEYVVTSLLVFAHSSYISRRKYDCRYMIVTYVSAVLEKLSTIFNTICEIHR